MPILFEWASKYTETVRSPTQSTGPPSQAYRPGGLTEWCEVLQAVWCWQAAERSERRWLSVEKEVLESSCLCPTGTPPKRSEMHSGPHTHSTSPEGHLDVLKERPLLSVCTAAPLHSLMSRHVASAQLGVPHMLQEQSVRLPCQHRRTETVNQGDPDAARPCGDSAGLAAGGCHMMLVGLCVPVPALILK